MTKQTRTILKGYFETGDIPTQGQYQDLIDSQLSLLDTDVQIVSGTISSSFLEVQHHITSSGNISSSGDLTVKDAEVSNDLTVRGDIKIAQASKIECITDSSTHIQLSNDDTWLFDAAGVEILKLTNDGSAGTPALIVNEGSADVDFRVESNGDTRAIFVDSGNGRVQIGSSTSTKVAIGTSTFGNSLVTINGDVTTTSITASGNISSSGTVKALDYMISGRKFANVSATDSAGIELGNGGAGNLLLTNLTASANISSSGTVESNGLILTSPDGTRYQISVANDGTLSTSSI